MDEAKETRSWRAAPQQDAFAMARLKALRTEKVDGWKKLGLRQNFADSAYLHRCAKSAGVKTLPISVEPATVKRVKQLFRRAKINPDEIKQAVGCAVPAFVQKNNTWPLWALVCSIAESWLIENDKLLPLLLDEP